MQSGASLLRSVYLVDQPGSHRKSVAQTFFFPIFLTLPLRCLPFIFFVFVPCFLASPAHTRSAYWYCTVHPRHGNPSRQPIDSRYSSKCTPPPVVKVWWWSRGISLTATILVTAVVWLWSKQKASCVCCSFCSLPSSPFFAIDGVTCPGRPCTVIVGEMAPPC